MVEPLPVFGAEPRERGDAAANREKILSAARSLLERCGADELTIDNVAGLAGVGKGTVFRRFGSRSGLMAALVNDYEIEWQAAVIGGPPPLGPGAPALDRLLAFGPSRIDLKLRHAPLFRAADNALAHNPAAFGFVARHVELLLRDLQVSGDVRMTAQSLLAPLELPLLIRQVETDRLSVERIKAGWIELARRIVA